MDFSTGTDKPELPALVAVYGSLRKGLGNHRVLADSEYVGTQRVRGYDMHSLGGFPVVYKTEEESPIVIEVYCVTEPHVMHNLDMLESHPTWYRRELVKTEFGKAWMYIMTDDRYRCNDVVQGGDWLTHCEVF